MTAGQHARRSSSLFGVRLLVCLVALSCAPGRAPVRPEPPAEYPDLSTGAGLVHSGVVLPGRAEIPNLSTVKRYIVDYHRNGVWTEQIDAVSSRAVEALDAGIDSSTRPAIVLDVDDTALSTFDVQLKQEFGFVPEYWDRWVREAVAPANAGILALYRRARERGVAVFFITGRRERLRDATERQLRAAGYEEWAGLQLKPNEYAETSVVPYKSNARRGIEASGFEILVNVGDQWSDLEGGFARATFKIPNPMYYIP